LAAEKAGNLHRPWRGDLPKEGRKKERTVDPLSPFLKCSNGYDAKTRVPEHIKATWPLIVFARSKYNGYLLLARHIFLLFVFDSLTSAKYRKGSEFPYLKQTFGEEWDGASPVSFRYPFEVQATIWDKFLKFDANHRQNQKIDYWFEVRSKHVELERFDFQTIFDQVLSPEREKKLLSYRVLNPDLPIILSQTLYNLLAILGRLGQKDGLDMTPTADHVFKVVQRIDAIGGAVALKFGELAGFQEKEVRGGLKNRKNAKKGAERFKLDREPLNQKIRVLSERAFNSIRRETAGAYKVPLSDLEILQQHRPRFEKRVRALYRQQSKEPSRERTFRRALGEEIDKALRGEESELALHLPG
jgi:hypothetical protein